MVGLTQTYQNQLLSSLTNQGTVTEITTPYLALFTAVPSDAGSGGTEAAYASYARQVETSWSAPTGTSPASVGNSGTITFPACTNSGTSVVETEIAWGLFTAVTGGTLATWDFLGSDTWHPFSCTLASPGIITVNDRTFTNGQYVVFTAKYGGTLPTGLTANTLYTVAGVSGQTFNVGTNTSAIGDGMVRQVVPQAIVPGSQPIINPGSAVISSS